MWHRASWRLGNAARFLVGAMSALVVRAIVQYRWLRQIPRPLVVPFERVLIAVAGADLFDPAHYLDRNPDVAAAGIPPLDHYLSFGWREQRPPNSHFDDRHYRLQAGLDDQVAVSALAHFLAIGRAQGHVPLPAADAETLVHALPALEVARVDGYRGIVTGRVERPEAARPCLDQVLARLAELAFCPGRPAVIDIVVPVYQGRAETLNTLLHVLTARNRLAAEVVVIDDATPEAELAADLDDLAARRLITLRRNPRNLGFPGSVNRGMTLHPGRDVIWLNADTEVYDGWVDRLHRAACSRAMVATVTPLTNNGTICSYPRPNTDNFGELELSWAAIDGLAARVNAGETVESPTAVGFATYVRRAALEAIGDLDAATFGAGYGEENDFCQRAIKAGWVNLLAADVVVRHYGATSFQGRRAERVALAMRVMDRLHPTYRHEVDAFIAGDPLAPARRRLDLARLSHRATGRAALLISHSRGGGTAQHVQEETARLMADGWTVYTLSGGAGGQGTVRLCRAGLGPLPGLAALELDGEALWQILRGLDLDWVNIHHLIDFPQTAPDIFRRRLSRIGLGYDVMVHDYFALCPRINMVDQRGHFCGEPALAGCAACLLSRGSAAGRPDIVAWRARHGALLREARIVRVPDDDVSRRLSRYHPRLGTLTVPHDTITPMPRQAVAPTPHLRIAVIGAIGAIKGFDAVLGLAHHVRARQLPAQITVIGYTHNDQAARAAGIEVTGAYLNDGVQRLIETADPHVVWIPSLWPETFCYTLSIAMQAGRPVAAFDLGAQAARIRRTGCGRVMPLADAYRPERLLDHLQLAAEPQAASTPAAA